MRHYTRQEWMDYCKGLLNDETKGEMERHLTDCGSCLELYISAIEETTEEDAAKFMSPTFADIVIDRISEESPGVKRKSPTKYPRKIFINYVVAAGLTLILTLSGFFQFLSEGIPKASDVLVDESVTFGDTVTKEWTEGLMNKTQSILNQINLFNMKE